MDEAQQLEGAKQSILNDKQVLHRLIEVLIDKHPDSSKMEPMPKQLLKTFITRGIFAMINALGAEYVSLIEQIGLRDKFYEYLLLGIHAQDPKSRQPMPLEQEGIFRTPTHLELIADLLRDGHIYAGHGRTDSFRWPSIEKATDAEGNALL